LIFDSAIVSKSALNYYNPRILFIDFVAKVLKNQLLHLKTIVGSWLSHTSTIVPGRKPTAKSSLEYRLQSHISVAKIGRISSKEHRTLLEKCKKIGRMLGKMMADPENWCARFTEE